MNMNQLDQAQYLVTLSEENATVLCLAHRTAFELLATALQMPFVVYELDPEEEPIVCQACHLASVKNSAPPTIH